LTVFFTAFVAAVLVFTLVFVFAPATGFALGFLTFVSFTVSVD
jgi:hypothetical protein